MWHDLTDEAVIQNSFGLILVVSQIAGFRFVFLFYQSLGLYCCAVQYGSIPQSNEAPWTEYTGKSPLK